MTGIVRPYFWLALFLLGAALIVAAITAAWEFRERRQDLVDRVSIAAAGRADLAALIAAGDGGGLSLALKEIAAHPAMGLVAVYGADARLLARAPSAGASDLRLPAIDRIRRDVSPTDVVAVGIGPDGTTAASGIWPALTGELAATIVSAPIIDTREAGASLSGAAAGAETAARGGSRIVVGYLLVAARAETIAVEALRGCWPILALFGLILTGIALCAWISSREFRAAAATVAALAQRVRQGDLSEDLKPSAPGRELRELFSELNGLLGGFRRYQQEVESGRKLLEKKADESAARLSLREAELEKAAEEISDTRVLLRRAANYDALTGLPNRNQFAEQLARVLRDTNLDLDPIGLLLVNLKNFRRVNESLGHGVGDEVLTLVAARLRAFLDGSAEVAAAAPEIRLCRVGGDEFALVLERLHDSELANDMATRILAVLAEPVAVQDHELTLSASIGVALAPAHGETVAELLCAATSAMRDCRNSHGGYRVYTPELDASGVDDFRLEADLRKALEENQLRLVYQPQIDTFDGSIAGAEALLRWEHPELGPVPPDRFIPLAEQSDLIGRLGEWVMLEVSRQLAAFGARGLELPRVAVNVSAEELNAEFAGRVSAILGSSGLAPVRLELGLSEAVFAGGDPGILHYLSELRNLGVYLSLDNFGTAGVPLNALVDFRLREVKLSRSFVRGCNQREDLARMVKAVISMAQSLKLRVVAEGVETAGEYRLLSNLGVRGMQGYLFSKPISAEELALQLSVPWYYAAQIQRMALTH